MKTVAILSLSFFTVLTGALLAPALPMIQQSYPTVPAFWLQMLMTIPSVVFLAMLLVLMRLPGTKKQQVLAGLVVYLVGGLLPLLPLAFGWLVVARGLSGVGLSLFAGPAVSLIGDFYPRAQRRKLLGWAAAVTSAGTIIAVSLAGVLSGYNWHWVFGLYALAGVPLVLVAAFVPETPAVGDTRAKMVVTPALLRTYALIAVWNGLYFVLPTTLPFYLREVLHDGNAAHAGTVLAAISVVGLLVSGSYAHLPKSLRLKASVSFAVLTVSAGCFLAANWWLLWVGIAIAGIGVGISMPVFNERLIAQSRSGRDHVLTTGSAMTFTGQFLSPFVFSGLALDTRLLVIALVALVVAIGVAWRRVAMAQ
ncbi:MFS transporter [Lacticaseibacillus sp. GG6-2]